MSVEHSHSFWLRSSGLLECVCGVSRRPPAPGLTVVERAVVDRFGLDARFEAGTRTMFGREWLIVTDHVLGRFAMFLDAVDEIAAALNAYRTAVGSYVWRDGVTGDVVGTDGAA